MSYPMILIAASFLGVVPWAIPSEKETTAERKIPEFRDLTGEHLQAAMQSGPKVIYTKDSVGADLKIFSVGTNNGDVLFLKINNDWEVLGTEGYACPVIISALSGLSENAKVSVSGGASVKFNPEKFAGHIIEKRKIVWIFEEGGVKEYPPELDEVTHGIVLESHVNTSDYRVSWRQVSGPSIGIKNAKAHWTYFTPKGPGTYRFELSIFEPGKGEEAIAVTEGSVVVGGESPVTVSYEWTIKKTPRSFILIRSMPTKEIEEPAHPSPLKDSEETQGITPKDHDEKDEEKPPPTHSPQPPPAPE